MQIGVMGLGRMGANIARRLMRRGHGCVVYDRNSAPGRSARRGGRGNGGEPRRPGEGARDPAGGLGHAAGGRGDGGRDRRAGARC